MSRTRIAEMQVPAWVQYVVITFDGAAAPCSTLETAVDTLVKHRLHFRAQVVRVDGDVTVWPWEVKGGQA